MAVIVVINVYYVYTLHFIPLPPTTGGERQYVLRHATRLSVRPALCLSVRPLIRLLKPVSLDAISLYLVE